MGCSDAVALLFCSVTREFSAQDLPEATAFAWIWSPEVNADTATHPLLSPSVEFSRERKGELQQRSPPGLQSHIKFSGAQADPVPTR